MVVLKAEAHSHKNNCFALCGTRGDRNGTNSKRKTRARQAVEQDSDSDYLPENDAMEDSLTHTKDARGSAQNRPYLQFYWFTLVDGKWDNIPANALKTRRVQKSVYMESKVEQLTSIGIVKPMKLITAFCLCKTAFCRANPVLQTQRTAKGKGKHITDEVIGMLCPETDALVVDDALSKITTQVLKATTVRRSTRASPTLDRPTPRSTPSNTNAFEEGSAQASTSVLPSTPASSKDGSLSLSTRGGAALEDTRKRKHSELTADEMQERREGSVQPSPHELQTREDKFDEGMQKVAEARREKAEARQTIREGEQTVREGEQAVREGQQKVREGQQKVLEGEQKVLAADQMQAEGLEMMNNAHAGS